MNSNGFSHSKKQSVQSPPTSPRTPALALINSFDSPREQRPTRDRAQFSFSGPTSNTFNNYYATGSLTDNDPDWYDPNQYEKRLENGKTVYIRLL